MVLQQEQQDVGIWGFGYFWRCCRTKIGTKKALVFPQPVDAMRIVGILARVWDQQSSWADRGPVLHCGMCSSMISQYDERSQWEWRGCCLWVHVSSLFIIKWLRAMDTWCDNTTADRMTSFSVGNSKSVNLVLTLYVLDRTPYRMLGLGTYLVAVSQVLYLTIYNL